MAQNNSNSTMEMGTSDQVLVSPKKNKTLINIIGGIIMLVVIGVVVTLVLALSGSGTEGGVAEPLITTEGPTPPDLNLTTSTVPTITTTPQPTTPEVTLQPIDLEDIINGVFTTASFNGTWSSGNEVLFRNGNGDLVLYDVDTDSPTMLVTNTSEILQRSSRVTQLSPNGRYVLLAYNSAPVYRYSFLAQYAAIDTVTGEVIDILPPNIRSSDAFLQNLVWGPSGTSLAFVYKNNIYHQNNLTTPPKQITSTGQLNVIYNGIPDWVYEEEVFASNNALWFSPDGAKIAYVTFDDTDVRIMTVPHYGVPGSSEFQYTQHHEIRYPKPGTVNPTVTVSIRDLESGESTTYEAPEDLHQPILKTVKFISNDSIALVWTNRVQTTLKVEICNQISTNCTEIYRYREPEGWIDNIPFLFNEQGETFITILPESVDGTRYKQIVEVSNTNNDLWTSKNRIYTPHTVADILFWTPGDVIWYKATHVNDSAEQHIYSVDPLGEVSCFTCSVRRADGKRCLYNDATFSSDGSKIIVNCAGPEVPQIFIYSSNGTLIRTWDDNSETISILSSKILPQTIRLSVPVAEGLPEADVQIQVPHDYQQRTNVPLLVYVYGGPDTAMVTKQWSIDWGTSLVSRWGIAVAHIDGRGSGLRGVANMFAVNRKLGTVEIDDQVTVTKYLQEQLGWVDGNRTCIWGWSYGGFAASHALARGRIFRCAAAVAPVADWHFYDSIYTERYMDVPQNNIHAYVQSSLLVESVVQAFKHKRYFLIHGTADDNVHYQHSMLISRLLQRRDVYFSQMSYTDEDHGLIGVRPHLYHSLEKFLRENMF